MRLAVLFPGQGAQYPGMGLELAAAHPGARRVFDEAAEVLGISLADVLRSADEEALSATELAQPAILTASVATWEAVRHNFPEPAFTAGLSLGEYSALVASKALSFPDALRLVRERARLMQEAVPRGRGGMLAVLGLADEIVAAICAEASAAGVVEPANYNCPGQVVLAGERIALEEAERLALARGAAKTVWLKVSAPFHSSLQRPAAEGLRRFLASITWRDPVPPVIANATAEPVSRAAELPLLLERQVDHPVLWEQSIRRLVSEGVDAFLEVGPGRSLSGFVKRITKPAFLANVEDTASLAKALDLWGRVC